MAKSKAAKIGAAVMILAVAGILAFRSLKGERGHLADRAQLVCVSTGEFFVIAVKDLRMYPAQNPKTGDWTLVPYYRDEQGVARIDRHYAPLVGELKDRNKYVDTLTFEVKTGGGK